MRQIITAFLVCVCLPTAPVIVVAAPEKNESAATASGGRASEKEAWRFKFYQGRWWYWLPAKQWAVYENGRWLIPPEASVASRREAPSSAASTEDKTGIETGSFAKDYPAGPLGSESEHHSAEYYLSTGDVYSRHAHEHAQLLERYAASGDTVPATVVREQAKAIHHDVEQAQKSFSRVATADEETTSETVPETVKKLRSDLRKVTESLRQLETRVQRQGNVEASLVRGQTAIINKLLQQTNEAARAAEEAQRKYEQNQKDLVGVE